jgi:glucosamine--fructose-6-phosphate aminotransferase (isomerizing)
MCGIVGYVGPKNAIEVILPGLAHLEYRGYDSAGIATVASDGISRIRNAGRIADLHDAFNGDFSSTGAGIGHTRWATHGAPTEENAHPHVDCSAGVAVVHNGIIENYAGIKDRLTAAGHVFTSDTDTEVLAHLIESHGELPLAEAVRRTMMECEGALAIAVIRISEPDTIVAARDGSPLVVGLGDGENFLASDIPAILAHTRKMLVIDDHRIVTLLPDSVEVTDLDGTVVTPEVREVDWDIEAAEKGGYDDFMIKEIYEQPHAMRDTLRGRIDDQSNVVLPEIPLSGQAIRGFDKVFVIACGTSYHAAMMTKYALERWTRMPVEIDIGSEFRYRAPVLDDKTLVIGISQSGETTDTLAAVRYAARQGAYVVAVTNVVDSSMARYANATLYTRSGPEIGVAATKTFISQLLLLLLFSVYLAQERGSLDAGRRIALLDHIKALPDQVAGILERADSIKVFADKWTDARDFFFLGRGVSCATAAEGALKLKEISYARAEYYPAGEMKHGPIALIDDSVVVVGVVPQGDLHSKSLANMEEMKARGANLLLLLTEGDQDGMRATDDVMTIPPTEEMLSPVLGVVPLQLLSYWIAKNRGLDVDKPRNLAKTVTVE